MYMLTLLKSCKLLNYFDREQNAGAEAAKPNKYLEKAAAMRKQAA